MSQHKWYSLLKRSSLVQPFISTSSGAYDKEIFSVILNCPIIAAISVGASSFTPPLLLPTTLCARTHASLPPLCCWLLVVVVGGGGEGTFYIRLTPESVLCAKVFDTSYEDHIVQKALGGFNLCALISAHYGLSDVFDNLVVLPLPPSGP
jgi:hypothetical protein